MSQHDTPAPTPVFAWQGRDAQGRPTQGRLNAHTAGLARAQLRRQGVQSVRLQRLWWDRPPRVRPSDLSLMTRQLAALLRAGVPLLQSLDMLSRSLTSVALLNIVQQVHNDVASGSALHEALARHPAHFTRLYTSMVQAGESAGILDTMMERLAHTLEKNEALRSRVRSALVYPTAVMGVAISVLVLILVFVVPVFEDVFKSFGAELPWATQIVVALSDGLSASGPVAVVVALLCLWFWQRPQAGQAQFKAAKDRWLLKLPMLGPLMGTAVVARWAQTLSALLSAGVPLAEALGPVAQACDHSVYEGVTLQLQRQVTQGSRLSEGMAQSDRFPPMIVQLCATGEETGAMDQLLARAGGLMETELDDRVNGLSSLLEPLIIVVLGGLIGGILVAMYLPIFRLGQVF
ncbi:type II secretion system F family protein [Limnohabitans sp.]|jgi:type IV pilus assembly protein PilC|uniref:type II secretion system F family protein n=1 Tax=Limnohabitans sp. TaxID=1907725 RepID=UPI001B5264E6|nr:type II secretion system F family protein [Limnohabitans sp.]MBP6219557.1 type II secretion system F family protein [Limnohabitans sp.]MBP6244662.1 type II secretion system F family protein [Limnohabitans sp.]